MKYMDVLRGKPETSENGSILKKLVSTYFFVCLHPYAKGMELLKYNHQRKSKLIYSTQVRGHAGHDTGLAASTLRRTCLPVW